MVPKSLAPTFPQRLLPQHLHHLPCMAPGTPQSAAMQCSTKADDVARERCGRAAGHEALVNRPKWSDFSQKNRGWARRNEVRPTEMPVLTNKGPNSHNLKICQINSHQNPEQNLGNYPEKKWELTKHKPKRKNIIYFVWKINKGEELTTTTIKRPKKRFSQQKQGTLYFIYIYIHIYIHTYVYIYIKQQPCKYQQKHDD